MSGFSATRLQILTLATLVLFAVGCARDRKGPGESVLSAMPAGQAVASQEQEITPLDFGAVGDGKADDTQPLQAAVDAAISKKIKLTSPMSAVYAIKAPIQVRSTLNADFQMAEIRAAAPMEALLRYETWDRYTLIQNLRLDGNLMADTCLDIVVGSKMRVDNLITGRHRKIALKIAKGNEIFVQNSHINAATPEDNSAESAEDTVGIDIATSDCHFSDIVIIDCKTAIINRGLNYYSRIHAWTFKPEIIKDSVFFDLWRDCIISESFADTFYICFRLRRPGIGCKIIGCTSYYNEEFYRADRGHVAPYLFWVDEGDGRGTAMQSSVMLAPKAMDGHYANIANCAVYTDGSTSFSRWQGAPEH